MYHLPWPGELKPAILIGRRGRFTVLATAATRCEAAGGAGAPIILHLPNSGRLSKVLTPGREVMYLPAKPAQVSIRGTKQQRLEQPRVTVGSLVLVRDPDAGWVCVDAGVPSRLLAAVLRSAAASAGHGRGHVPEHVRALAARLGSYSSVRTEPRHGTHRFDLALLDDEDRTRVLVECKSITLVENGTGLFPDAPTVRGTAHVRLLGELAAHGHIRTALVFIVGRNDARLVRAHREMDPVFADALEEARQRGLDVMGYRLAAGPSGVDLGEEVDVPEGDRQTNQ